MRKSVWKDLKPEDPGYHEMHDKFFPKWYKLEYDHTNSKSGCFKERTG